MRYMRFTGPGAALALALVIFGSAAAAQVSGQRSDDVVLGPEAMASEVVGRTHLFFDGGQSFFSISGTYTYTYSDGGVAYGRYEVRDNGMVCTYFSHGFERCDTYVKSGERMVLITEDGVRFPVKELS